MSNQIAGFARGVLGGVAMARRYRDDGSDQAPSAAPKPAEAPATAATVANGYRTQDPVAPGLKPYEKAFLNAISAGESEGDYNVRFGGKNGPQQFEGFDKHPNILEDGPEGKSSAAGRYEFTGSTWDDMGGGAFTPEAQDTRALALARQRYSASTGRDLDADLQTRGFGADIASPLRLTWTSLRDNPGRATAAYEDSLKRYASAEADSAPVDTADLPKKPHSIIETLAGNAKRNIETAKENLAAIGSPQDNWKALRGLFGKG